MSNYFAIESIRRNRDEFPNPAEFTVEASQTRGWFKSARQVRAIGQNPQTMSLDFVSAIEVKQVITPFHIPDPPPDPPSPTPINPYSYLYLDIHSPTYNDQYLINTISGANRDARFILIRDKIIYNSAGKPTWILWTSPMEQVLRFKRNDPLVFRLFTPNGITLPLIDNKPEPNESVQIMALLGVTPYSRDGNYDNHLLQYLS